MAKFLSSGGVIPSHAGVSDSSINEGHNISYSNFSLKIGQITKVYYSKDDNNRRFNLHSYDVQVLERHGDKASTSHLYRHCVVQDLFGGIADYFQYTLRESTDGQSQFPFNNGSLVLLLCVNGTTDEAVIVGGVRHSKREGNSQTQEEGHHLLFEFNGLNFKIDKNGATTILFKGATDINGKPLDEKVGGTYFKIEKDGSIEYGDGAGQSHRLDKPKKTFTKTSEGQQSFLTKAEFIVSADKDIKLTAKGQLMAEITGASTWNSESFMLEAKSSFKLKAFQEVSIEAKVAKFIGQSNTIVGSPAGPTTIDGNVVLIAGGGALAAKQGSTAVGIGNLGGSVVSTIIDGSTKVFLGG